MKKLTLLCWITKFVLLVLIFPFLQGCNASPQAGTCVSGPNCAANNSNPATRPTGGAF